MRRQPFALSIPALFLSTLPLWAQATRPETALFVGDLVGLGGRPVPILPLTGTWAVTRARRWIPGELDLFLPRQEEKIPHVPRSGFFDREGLRSAVAKLAGIDESELAYRSGASLWTLSEHAEKCSKALAALRRSLPPRVQLRAGLLLLRGSEQTDLLGETVEIVPGCARLLGSQGARRALIGYEAEIASGSSILNPVVVDCTAGVMLAVRVRMAPQGDRSVADLVLRHVDDTPTETIATGHPGCGAIDRLASRALSCCAVVELTNGAAREIRWRRGANEEYRLTLQARWALVPPQPDGDLVFYDSMATDLPAFATPTEATDEAGQPEEDDEAPSVANLDAFAATSDYPNGAWVVFGADGQRARGSAQRWFESLSQPSAVDVRFLELPAGAPLPPADAPADASLLWAGELPVLAGQSGVVHDVRNQQFLADWDVEVAGQSRIPVPRLRHLQTGLTLDWRTDGSTIELTGDVSWHLGTEVHTGSLDMAIMTASALGNQGTLPPVALPQDVVAIEMPRTLRLPFAWRLPFDKDGVATARQSAPDRAGRELVVVARLLH